MPYKKLTMARKILMLFLMLMLLFADIASAGNVSSDQARNAAKNWLTWVVHAYGSWGGDKSPDISDEEPFVSNGMIVGYNFTVSPKGHILVSARDDIPAVKLYSENATLSLRNQDLQEQIDWISKEIFDVGEAIDTHSVDMAAAVPSRNPDRKVWAMLDKGLQEFAATAGEAATATGEAAAISYGPLLTTTWNQPDPYNQQCPLYNGSPTLVGCVATAAAQIMRYWNYPAVGQGSTSYSWWNGANNVTLIRNFSGSTYDWANMPGSVSSASTTTQKNAVSKLCADVGIAFHMIYGTSGSGAYTSDSPDVLTTYFKYQNTAHWVNRSSYVNASAWMQVFKTEVQAGRPSQLSIRDPNAGGHSVVVDGYRDTPSETVHINMGWSGNYDGWYTPDSFVTAPYNWTDTSSQGAAIGIQPPAMVRVDFNGDRKSDLLWRNTSDGRNVVWYMNGAAMTGWDYLPAVTDMSWSIAGAGDFNGDGKSDILWRNASGGQNAVWYMNGATMTGWDYLPTVADTSWTIVGK